MKLTNTTDVPDYALRRLVAWCCRFHGLPVNCIREAVFRNRGDSLYSGRAYYGTRRIVVSVGRVVAVERRDPDRKVRWYDYVTATIDDRMESFVRVTAHEVFHIFAHANGINSRRHRRGHGSSENQTEWHERKALDAFRADRERLMDEWFRQPAQEKSPKPTLQGSRAAAATAGAVSP